MIEINKCTEPISNCNVCGAINFERSSSLNRRVDGLSELWIGQSVLHNIVLCEDCLLELSDKLRSYIYL